MDTGTANRYNVSVTSPSAVPPEIPPVLESSSRPQESRRLRYFELGLVLLVAFSRSFIGSLSRFIQGQNTEPVFTAAGWVSGVVSELTALLLLGYVLYRQGRRFRDLGLNFSAKQWATGFWLGVVAYSVASGGAMLMQFMHRAMYGTAVPRMGIGYWAHAGFASIPASMLAPIFEELIVRAYLMTEIMELTGSAALAVAVSVLIQTSYHLYYGWYGALHLGFFFLVLALYFAKSRLALPGILAHGLLNVLALSMRLR
ncbi:MAG TPA: CPBP family intramembrane glutamic endopeptidase [Candidatus Acidoferrales bacterium]